MIPVKNPNFCPVCRNPVWRHKSSCPVLQRILLQHNLKAKITSNEISGATPPSILVGEHAYPKVNVGLLLSPETGDTSIYDAPKTWYQQRMSIEDVFKLRLNLLNAKRKFGIDNATKPDKYLDMLQQVAASSVSLDTEVILRKKPRLAVYFDPASAPYGPEGILEKMEITENPKIDRRVDYIISDLDLKAQPAILDLYKHGYDVYNISKILSVGLLGIKIQRKLVPTKWSITTTDSIIINKLLDEVKQHQSINEYQLYESNYMGNYFEVLLMPTQWMFEMIEIAVPGATWMEGRNMPLIGSDYEFYWGRKTYASNVAGGYYAAELAVLEFLSNIKRQAGVLIVREIRPEYYAPIGVWKIRECIRDAMKQKPILLDSIEQAIKRIDEKFITKNNIWKPKSKIMSYMKNQKNIKQFLK